MRSDGLVIVIPVYRGAATVGDVVRRARSSGHPVVVVDDGSDDASGAEAEAAGAEVLRHPINQGKGAALRSGFSSAARAGASGVLTLDADGQHDPAEIPSLVAAHRAAPRALVIGVRRFDDAAMPAPRRVGNRMSTFWISKFAGRPHRDSQSGFRVYPRELFDGAALRSSRFETETELLLLAAHRGLPLVEVEVRTIYRPGAATHFRSVRDTLRIMQLVVGSPFWRRT
jgi:glycosyltransferase involved in cell wall biosynthesis